MKDQLSERLGVETQLMDQKMQEIANEKKKYMAKVEVILTEQRDLRSKDQTLFK